MVQFYRKTHEYPDPPPTPLLAFFLRYPNPFARHVLSVDILSRTVDPITGQIITSRLVLKRGIVPRWASSWLPSAATSGGRGLDAWVLEESIVDPPEWGLDGVDVKGMSEDEIEVRRQPRLRSRQGNLSFKKFMHVVEGGELKAGPNGTTLHHTTAEVKSDLGGSWSSMIRSKIEAYGVGKFEGNAETSRKGMSLILTLLRTRQPLPETAEFAIPLEPDASQPDDPPPFQRSRERSPASFFLSPNSLSDLSARWAKRRAEVRSTGGDSGDGG